MTMRRDIVPDRSVASRIHEWLLAHQDEMLKTALDLARHESPSGDSKALVEIAGRIGRRFQEIGAVVEPRPAPEDRLNLRIRYGSVGEVAPALILCHFDTVWPIGTIASMPVHVEGDRAHGPGLYDMKASFVLFEFALRAIQALELALARPVVGLFTCDEETGSRTSRPLIEEEARRAACALVLEAPLSDGRLKTARKGVGAYTIEVAGRAAHAGVEPEKGVSATVELAHQILAIQTLARPEQGTTINIGTISGGTANNIVAPLARAEVDLRVSLADEAERVDRELHALAPVLKEARITIQGGINRPPMVRSAASGLLFERVRGLGRLLDIELGEGSTGGGSDGNFTAAVGVPTLDGLGCEGAGAHASHEHILISSLCPRASLLALLLLDPWLVPQSERS